MRVTPEKAGLSRALTFGQALRLKKTADFSLLFNKGKRYFTTSFIFFVLIQDGPATPGWRLGLSVSRKVGGAVRRNRVKRLLREFFRLRQADLPQGLEVAAVCRKGLNPLRLNYAEVEQEIAPLLEKWLKYHTPRPRP